MMRPEGACQYCACSGDSGVVVVSRTQTVGVERGKVCVMDIRISAHMQKTCSRLYIFGGMHNL